MAGKPKKIDLDKLMELAIAYCDDCISYANENMAASGKVVNVKKRQIPTIGYFLSHWLRRQHFDFYQTSNWYDAKENPKHPCSDAIKSIDKMFNDLATDIVANEGKGIFYAKNKLGMTDQQQIQTDGKIEVVFIDQNKD